MRIRRSRIAFVARLGSNDRDILRTAPIYTSLKRDSYATSAIRHMKSVSGTKQNPSVLVTSKSYGESSSECGSRVEVSRTGRVGFLIQESYFNILVSGSEVFDTRVSAKEFNSVRLAPLIFCYGNAITGLKTEHVRSLSTNVIILTIGKTS